MENVHVFRNLYQVRGTNIVIDKKYHLTDIEDGITLGAGLSPCSLASTEIDSRLRTLTLKSPSHWENESGSIYRFLVKINL